MKFLVELLIVAALWAVGMVVAYFGLLCLAAENLCENDGCGNFAVYDVIGAVLLIVAAALLVGAPFLARRAAR